MRWLLALAAAGAFLAGAGLAAGGSSKDKALVAELLHRQEMLEGDVKKVGRAAADVEDIRKTRAAGKFVLNEEEKRLEKRGRVDFHIFLERIRNDTLEVLQIYDRVLHKQAYIDPLERLFGDSLHQVVNVQWEDLPLDDVAGELSQSYGVPIDVGGAIDYRKTMSLDGDMSLFSILLYIENLYDARLVVKGKRLGIVRLGHEHDKGEGKGEGKGNDKGEG